MTETKTRENPRREVVGKVISDKMDKTIVVQVERTFRHPFYGKVIRRRSKFYSQDDKNVAKTGDLVRLAECRRLSHLKRWRLVEVLKKSDA